MVDSENTSIVPTLSSPVARAPLPRWTVPVVAVLVLGAAAVASALLWRWVDGLAFVDSDKKAAAYLDVLKLAASIAVGGGGLFALYLAARRQRTQELELEERKRELEQRERVQAHAVDVQAHAVRVAEINRLHAERVAEATERDAAARRVTDLFARAVEQLGSDKAAVRLGGLYALERLAQDNLDQRPTVVRVFCAYLRMPFELPGDPPQPETGPEYEAAVVVYRERVQEREVRVAAQRILGDHLRPGDGSQPVAAFWPDTDLDLTGAHLIDFDLNHCITRTARFSSATFAGDANFRSATFASVAYFGWAAFTDNAYFSSATFTDNANFESVRFDRGVPPELQRFLPAVE
ncbi:pentapeptide repeat-containing protein [Umezawaea tangerina]|uniref:Pentapeptide repeat protein n=1 Tax=Umezawaea tangerina TaxID=84725 RepID=A0A2T0SNV8_9PSEU|nr:pentapeptide repeat-containing protein [Umezawaea tangerina]PRY35090.1 hypothetical protein CLV43_1148 [Umezawaea tangerina]